MIKGLYQSASAMLPRIKQQETIANNLANASSAGFKRDLVFTKELNRVQQQKGLPRHTDWQRPMIDQVYTSFTQGTLDKTENPYDIAIDGPGFFVFESEGGTKVLSRAGSLSVSPEGVLINSEGQPLMGDGGPINIGSGPVSISETGQVQVNNTMVGQIQVVDVEDKEGLQKAGSRGFVVPETVELLQAADFAVRQGYLESSNVDVIREMIDMIISFRNYEADAKAVQTQDDSLEKLINNVGRVR